MFNYELRPILRSVFIILMLATLIASFVYTNLVLSATIGAFFENYVPSLGVTGVDDIRNATAAIVMFLVLCLFVVLLQLEHRVTAYREHRRA